MTRILMAALAAAAFTALAHAQSAPFIDISADDSEVFDDEGRLVYRGDVNILRGDARLRADEVVAYYTRQSGEGLAGRASIQRIVAAGDVFYVTPAEIARGDRGVYDLEAGTIELTGSVVLTQGCNVSTGERLIANIDGGGARLSGGESSGGRVRSVFFDDPQAEPGAAPAQADCPTPEIPGDGPEPFVPDTGN